MWWAACAFATTLAGLLAWGLHARGLSLSAVATVMGGLVGTQGLIAFAWLRSPERTRARDRAIEGLADHFDLAYDRRWRGGTGVAHSIFSLFGSNAREQGRNVLAWRERRVPGASDGYYMDYEWPGDRGPERRSVVVFRFEGAPWPPFALRPSGRADRLNPRFIAPAAPAIKGAEADPVRLYTLDAQSAPAILPARTRAALRRRGLPLCVEAAGEWMILWDREVPPEAIEPFVAKAQEIAVTLAADIDAASAAAA